MGARSLEGVQQGSCSWNFGFHTHQGGREEDTECGRQARLVRGSIATDLL